MKRRPNPELIDKENPEWVEPDFARAKPFQALRPSLRRKLGVRGPQKAPTKEHITIRLSPEVVERFRATGAGWQTRVDSALRDWLKAGRIRAMYAMADEYRRAAEMSHAEGVSLNQFIVTILAEGVGAIEAKATTSTGISVSSTAREPSVSSFGLNVPIGPMAKQASTTRGEAVH